MSRRVDVRKGAMGNGEGGAGARKNKANPDGADEYKISTTAMDASDQLREDRLIVPDRGPGPGGAGARKRNKIADPEEADEYKNSRL